MPKNITKEESTLICKKFHDYEGRWDNIMEDKEIKALGFSRYKLQCHVNYKKKVMVNQISPRSDGGAQKRTRVLQKILKKVPNDETSSTSDYNENESEKKKEENEKEIGE